MSAYKHNDNNYNKKPPSTWLLYSFIAVFLGIIFLLVFLACTPPTYGQQQSSLRPGVGYDPFPHLPNPWAIAVAKGLILNEHSSILNWANGPTNPIGEGIGQFTPGDPDVHAAYVARYNRTTNIPAPCGAENAITLFPTVLDNMWHFEWQFLPGRQGVYDGRSTPREHEDAVQSCAWDLYCKTRNYTRQPGYDSTNPQPVDTPDMPNGLVHLPLPSTHPLFRASRPWNWYNCGWWYINSHVSHVPTPSSATCGNNTCDPTETHETCPLDCLLADIPNPPDPTVIDLRPTLDECLSSLAAAQSSATVTAASLAACQAATSDINRDLQVARDSLAPLQAANGNLARQVACLTTPPLPQRCLDSIKLIRSLAASRTSLRLGAGWQARMEQCIVWLDDWQKQDKGVCQ